MLHTLLWVEVLAAALLLVACVTAAASRLKWRWHQILWPTLVALLTFGLALVPVAVACYLRSKLLVHDWVIYTISLAVVFAAGALLIIFRGLWRKDGVVTARAWPLARLGVGLVAATALFGITFWNMDLAVRSRVAGLRAEAGTLALSVAPARVPDNENAAFAYQKAFDAMGKQENTPPAWEEAANAAGDPRAALNINDPNLRAFMKTQEPALALLRRAAAMPHCYFDRNYGQPGYDMALPDLTQLWRAGNLLAIDARLKAADGKVHEALEDLAAAYAMAQQIVADPMLISDLVAMSTDRLATNGLEGILATARPSAGDLALLKLSDGMTYEQVLPRSMRMKEAMGLSALAMLAEGEEGFTVESLRFDSALQPFLAIWRVFLVPDEVASYRAIMRRVVELAGRPYYAARDDWKTLEHGIQYGNELGIVARMIMPAITGIPASAAGGDARHRLATVAVAMAACRAKTGKYPAALPELVPEYLAAVPLDPFDGKPLRMKTSADGIVLYSIGPDFTDDGGKDMNDKDSKGDITFHLPAK